MNQRPQLAKRLLLAATVGVPVVAAAAGIPASVLTGDWFSGRGPDDNPAIQLLGLGVVGPPAAWAVAVTAAAVRRPDPLGLRVVAGGCGAIAGVFCIPAVAAAATWVQGGGAGSVALGAGGVSVYCTAVGAGLRLWAASERGTPDAERIAATDTAE